jgi:hypothetical protein
MPEIEIEISHDERWGPLDFFPLREGCFIKVPKFEVVEDAIEFLEKNVKLRMTSRQWNGFSFEISFKAISDFSELNLKVTPKGTLQDENSKVEFRFVEVIISSNWKTGKRVISRKEIKLKPPWYVGLQEIAAIAQW